MKAWYNALSQKKKWWFKLAYYEITACIGIVAINYSTQGIISLIPASSFGQVIVLITGWGVLLSFQYLWWVQKAIPNLMKIKEGKNGEQRG
jgi:protein-S-isoprenylcysteine O-methyltransferase Ste14